MLWLKKDLRGRTMRWPWLILIPLLLTFINNHAQTQWTDDGSHISTSTAAYVNMHVVPDGSGGFFLTYEYILLGDTDIYAQWIDGSGTKRWGSSDVEVTSAAGNQKNPVIAPDGSGGAFVAWQDETSKKIYVQHISNSGFPDFPSGPITACTTSGVESRVQIISDGSGGAILVWMDKRNLIDNDLYAQRISASGTRMWSNSGVPVTTASNEQSTHVIVGDGQGGVCVVWQDYRNSNYDIYAQRLEPTFGNTLWSPADGVAIETDANSQLTPSIALSGTKIVISWNDYVNSGDIYAQALNLSDGSKAWNANGLALVQTTDYQSQNCITGDGSGGALIAWTDNRGTYNIYAQKVNSNGSIAWKPNGIAVNQSSGYQSSPRIVSDNLRIFNS